MRIDLETMNMNNEYDDLSVEKKRIWWYAKKVYLCLTFWFAEQIRKD